MPILSAPVLALKGNAMLVLVNRTEQPNRKVKLVKTRCVKAKCKAALPKMEAASFDYRVARSTPDTSTSYGRARSVPPLPIKPFFAANQRRFSPLAQFQVRCTNNALKRSIIQLFMALELIIGGSTIAIH